MQLGIRLSCGHALPNASFNSEWFGIIFIFYKVKIQMKKLIFPPVSAYSFYVAELVDLRIFEVSLECVVSLFIDVILELWGRTTLNHATDGYQLHTAQHYNSLPTHFHCTCYYFPFTNKLLGCSAWRHPRLTKQVTRVEKRQNYWLLAHCTLSYLICCRYSNNVTFLQIWFSGLPNPQRGVW